MEYGKVEITRILIDAVNSHDFCSTGELRSTVSSMNFSYV